MNIESEREAFEAWAKGKGMALDRYFTFQENEVYEWRETQSAYESWLARAQAGSVVEVEPWHLIQLRAAFNSLSGHVLRITGGDFYKSNGVDIRCSPWTELASAADWLKQAIDRLPEPPKEDGE